MLINRKLQPKCLVKFCAAALFVYLMISLQTSRFVRVPKFNIISRYYDLSSSVISHLNVESDNNFNNEENNFNNQINLINVGGLYLEPNRSAVYFTGDDVLSITLLTQTRLVQLPQQLFDDQVSIRVKRAGKVVFERSSRAFQKIYMKTNDYIFSTIIESVPSNVLLCSSCDGLLTYQLTANGVSSSDLPVNVVDKSRNDNSRLTARLIKCMWIPDDVETFRYIMRLIIESRYDSIYVCVFREDFELKRVLAELGEQVMTTTTTINVIELESIPHVMPGGRELTSREQISNDNSIQDKGWFMDPALEFLLNLVYPFLVEKYRYVQAADFDHILFTKNLTFYERVNHLAATKLSQNEQHASIYLDQYWALDNQMTRRIFREIDGFVRKNPKFNDNISISGHEMERRTLIPLSGFSFQIKISGKDEWMYAFNFLDYVRRSLMFSSFKTDSRNQREDSEMFRRVIVKFEHSSIFGQTIHNTKSSRLIKLCTPGEFFKTGLKSKTQSQHLVHYRDSYNFDLLKQEGKYIPLTNFITWDHFKSELDI